MRAETKNSFAFLVLALNHQDYILEHLESIKYLVQTYGSGRDIDLIINDDCSSDQTQTLVDYWIAINAKMFRNVKTIYNSSNLGTCASVDNMLSYMEADGCKITAGDDVYSFENIFELSLCKLNTAIVSGRALYLVDNELGVNQLHKILETTTQIIYQNNSLLHRFKHISYNNAPNIVYRKECLLNSKVRAYLRLFNVVEDWPLQVAIAREFPNYRMVLIDNVLVYYRRTAGSTYIVENVRFRADKLRLYDDLIQNETKVMEKWRLLIRRICFKSNNSWINKFINFDLYIFMTKFIINITKIIIRERSYVHSINDHRRHYSKIQIRALAIKKLFNQKNKNIINFLDENN